MSSSRRSILPPVSKNLSARIFSSPRNSSQVDIHAVHKEIIHAVENIEKIILSYGDLLMEKPESSIQDVVAFCRFLEEQLQITEIISPNLLLSILEKYYKKVKISEPVFNDLKTFGERLQLIQTMLREIPPNINRILKVYVMPNCVSFIEEAGSKEVPPITKEYNDIIINNVAVINKLFDEIKTHSILKSQSFSVREYIKMHDDINCSMLRWSNAYLEICSLLKSWVDIDRLYPEKLEETVFWLRDRRKELFIKLKQVKTSQMKLETKQIDLGKLIDKTVNQINQAKFNLNHFNQRDKNVNAAKVKIEKDIQEMSQTRESHMEERERCADSKIIEYLDEQIILYNSSISEARKRLKRLNSISMGFIGQQQNSLELANKINQNLSKDKENLAVINSNIAESEKEINELLEKICSLEEQIILVQNIKSCKLGNQMLYQVKEKQSPRSFTDQTDNFFKLAAPVIGNLWKEVYKKLIFYPPRDWRQLELDLEAIDINNKRLDPSFETLAYLSLQKWRRLSDQATINNLITVLKKFNLARYIVPQSKERM